MRFDLTAMYRRSRNPRRSQIVLRPIVSTAAQAGGLYATAFKPVIEAWRAALPMIEARYTRALPVHDAIHDAAFDLESILAGLDDALARLVLTITPALRDWSLRMESWQRGKWRGAVLTATGVDLATMLSSADVADTVDAFVARNVALVRSVSQQTRDRVADVVFRGYQARTPIRQVAKEMDEAVWLGRKRALRIAADQSSKLANRLDQARQEQAGLTSFKWRHSHKKHPRAVHVAHDGVVFRWDKLPLLDGRPDAPGQAPFCGCRSQAVLTLD